MRFWDSSAVVPLLVQEPLSPLAERLFEEDREVVLWWGAELECRSALARTARESRISEETRRQCQGDLRVFVESAFEVQPAHDLKLRAMRLVDIHPLRASDSLQLAAALLWCREKPSGAGFVCFDRRVRDAAHREGFDTMPENLPL